MSNSTKSTFNKPIFINTAIPERPTHNYSARGLSGVVLRHSQFSNDMGSPSITVNNVGYTMKSDGTIVRHPLYIFCDPLSDQYGGLMPTTGPIYNCAALMTRFVEDKQRLMAVVHDAHVGTKQVNLEAVTQVCITVDYYVQMTPEERDIADQEFMLQMEIPNEITRENQKRAAERPDATPVEKFIGERWLRYEQQKIKLPAEGRKAEMLTVAQVIELHGESPDGEFRDFLFSNPHGIEPSETGLNGLYKWVPFMRDVFERVILANKTARQRGITAPESRILSFHKNDLRPGVPNGQRGTGGNALEEFFLASQYGLPQGPEHDYQRKVVIFGMGTPYTVNFAISNALALGCKVMLQMDATFNFDLCGVSMYEVARHWRHMYPYAFEASIGWNEKWMAAPEPIGPDGRTYNQLARESKVLLEENHASTGGKDLNLEFDNFFGVRSSVFADFT